jgi:hypothetical protein
MAIPANVMTKLEALFHNSHNLHMTEAKTNVRSANNIVRHSSAKMFDEPTPQQARAIDKILRLPKA